jgi:pyruvate/2-oxoglutarate dehydrogenase complex dihydrolipoamide acyltransferase (E2) component
MFGLRTDGKQVKDVDPIQRIMPHIMKHRHDSQNLTSYDVPCEPFDAFIKQELAEGSSYNYMHIVIAGIVRLIGLFPRINRFIMNGRIYNRNSIQVSFVVKKGLSADAADTTVKIDFTGQETIAEVRDKVNAAIMANNNMDANNGTDKLARLITFTPNFLISFLVGTIKFLDKHGMLPAAILRVSPFHTSAFVTNLKSIKGPSIFHHLYDFGTTGLFFAMGKEAMVPVVSGKEIVIGKRMPMQIVTDERFCDGFYFVTALKKLRELWNNPALMKERLEQLATDVKVIDRHSYRKRNQG